MSKGEALAQYTAADAHLLELMRSSDASPTVMASEMPGLVKLTQVVAGSVMIATARSAEIDRLRRLARAVVWASGYSGEDEWSRLNQAIIALAEVVGRPASEEDI